MSSKITRRVKHRTEKLNIFILIPLIIICVYLLLRISHYINPTRDDDDEPLRVFVVPKMFTPSSQVADFNLGDSGRISVTVATTNGAGSHRANISKRNNNQKCPVTIVLILCNDGNKKAKVNISDIVNSTRNGTQSSSGGGVNSKQPARSFERQINQTVVLLKSIAVQHHFLPRTANYNNKLEGQEETHPPGCVEVLLLSDQVENFMRVKQAIESEHWANEFSKRILLKFIPVSYPPGSQWMRKLFRPCATLRLFLAELLPTYDSVIYLDTDIIFLRSLVDLWKEFDRFARAETLAAMAPCLNHYGTNANQIPYYGQSGLNAGIMLMNLTRIRSSGWTKKIREVTSVFQRQIKLADQDILNIYFHSNPDELHELTCDWNFRPFQCRKGSFCQEQSLGRGISALHGNALSFTPEGPEPLFHSVFSTFQQLNLTVDSSPLMLHKLIRSIQVRLKKVQGRSRSDCSRYGAFSILLLNRFYTHLFN